MPIRLGSAMPSATRYFDAPSDVVLHLRAPLGVAGVQEFLAVAGGTAKIGHAAPRSRDWRRTAPARCSPTDRAPKDRRAPPSAPADSSPCHTLRQRQVGGNLQAVGGFVADRLHGRKRFARQFFADLVLKRKLARFAVEQICLAGLRVAVRADQPLTARRACWKRPRFPCPGISFSSHR